MPDFNRVRPFRFWCQKVLPLVYDDSLSYYELLNKVVDYLNKTIEDVNSVIQLTEDFTEEQTEAYAEFTAGIEQTVDTLTNSFNTLHDFVDDYFDNLDVQEEIDNKLDEMVIDGTLYNMFAPIAEDAVPSLVTQWLNEHITPTSPPVDKTLTVSNAAADAKVVGTNFDDLKQRMSLEEEWEIPITFEDLIQGGYNSDGSVNADGTNYLRPPQMIPIYPGMSMHFKGGAVIDRMKAGYFDPVTRRYDASKDIAWFTGERTITFDMYGLIIPLFRRASNTEVIPTDFDAEFELISETKTRIETRVLYKNSGEMSNGDITSGTGLECGYSIQPRKNLVITFSGKIPTGSTFTNLEIGLKSGSTKYNNLVIDSQNVTFTTMVNTVVTKPHGLTITKNIQVSIKTILENKAIVRITSNGSSVDLEFTPYQQWRIASAYAETSGSLTLCTLSCINQDIAKPIWFFGDSYTAYASNRWPFYADKWVNNILLDGYGGETSNYVITAFETYLTSGYPQYAVFATGMNDGSDTDASTPNADWLSAVEEFIEICEDNQIIPILCTVPTTPVYNNNGKNVYVRTSGYWYIDFAKAVGADGTGAWYTGMLGTDNIHPTVAGAKALCAQIEADFPEVFIQGVETDKSLSRFGVAADAGTCGERFDEVDGEISGLREDLTALKETAVRGTIDESLVENEIDMSNAPSGTLDSDGNVIESSTLVVSDFIDISNATRVFRYGSDVRLTFYRYAVYDINHNLLQYHDSTTEYDFVTIGERQNCTEYDITSTDAYYIRISTNLSYTGLKYAMLVNSPTSYALDIPIYAPNITQIEEAVESLSEEIQDIPTNVIEAEKEETVGKRIIDITINSSIGALEENGVNPTRNTFITSDYIPLDGVEKFYRYGYSVPVNLDYYAIYDKDKNVIKWHDRKYPAPTEEYDGRTDVTFYDIDEPGAKYIRLSTVVSLADYVFAEYGVLRTDYTVTGYITDKNTPNFIESSKKVNAINDTELQKFIKKSAVIFKYGDEGTEEETYYDESNVKVSTNGYDSSPIVPIENGYSYVAGNCRTVCYFDEDKSFISGFKPYTTDSNVSVFTVNNPSVKYARFSFFRGLSVEVYGVMKYTEETDVVCMGDSIIGQYPPIQDIPSVAQIKSGITFANVGVGGTIAGSRTGDYDYWSFYKLADAIASGDFSEQEARIVDGYSHFRLRNLLNADFSKVKMITLNYGTNDWNFGNPIDNPQNKYDTATYKGALRYGVETILTAYPQIIILFMSPIYRKWDGEGTDTRVNINGKTLMDFVQAQKEVAEEYNMPFVDFYHSCGINGFTVDLYTKDGTHPSYIDGISLLGNKLGGIVESIL